MKFTPMSMKILNLYSIRFIGKLYIFINIIIIYYPFKRYECGLARLFEDAETKKLYNDRQIYYQKEIPYFEYI